MLPITPAPRAAAAWPLRLLLGARGIRRRLAFAIWHDYFADLRLTLPLGDGFVVPLDHRDALEACAETFLGLEYGALLDRIPLPGRWLDVGSHRGYFSLWLAWQRVRRGAVDPGRAVLIDGDPRAGAWFDSLIASNPQLVSFHFVHAAVALGQGDAKVPFALRPGMGSSIEGATRFHTATETADVPHLTVENVTARLAPPYDLVKVDIEGAEDVFMDAYRDLLLATNSLALEWHAWDGDAAAAEARAASAAAALGFGPPDVLRPVRLVRSLTGQSAASGVHLYRRSDR